MRIIIGLIILLTFANASQCQQQKAVKRIEFSKVSRGYEEHVSITADSVNVLVNNHLDAATNADYGRTIEKREWVSLVDALSGLKLQDVPSLPSPTMNRAADAAKHSTIKIVTGDGKEYEHGFDDDNPNSALGPLLAKIREVSGRNK